MAKTKAISTVDTVLGKNNTLIIEFLRFHRLALFISELVVFGITVSGVFTDLSQFWAEQDIKSTLPT